MHNMDPSSALSLVLTALDGSFYAKQGSGAYAPGLPDGLSALQVIFSLKIEEDCFSKSG